MAEEARNNRIDVAVVDKILNNSRADVVIRLYNKPLQPPETIENSTRSTIDEVWRLRPRNSVVVVVVVAVIVVVESFVVLISVVVDDVRLRLIWIVWNWAHIPRNVVDVVVVVVASIVVVVVVGKELVGLIDDDDEN